MLPYPEVHQGEHTLTAFNTAHRRAGAAIPNETEVERVPRPRGLELGEVRSQLVDVPAGPSRIGANGGIE
jgi:hypothetical protein